MRTQMINLTFMLFLTFTYCSSSKFANIINQFVELNNELGIQKEDVGVIITGVKNVLTEEEKLDDAHFRALTQNCNSGEAAVNGAIAKLSNEVNESTKRLNDWKSALANSFKDVAKAKSDITSTGQKIVANQKSIDKALEDFKVTVTETDQKLNVVKTLRDIITDELINNAGAHSFVQLNKFTDKLNELRDLLNNDNDSLYSPLVSVLLELATEQNFSDQGILKKILQNIHNLDVSLRNFRKQREDGLNNEMKSLKSNAVNLGKIKNAYENMLAQSVSKRIDAQHYITFYTNEIAHFNAETGRKNDEKALLGKLCAFEKTAHEKDKQNLQNFKAKVLPYIIDQIQKLH